MLTIQRIEQLRERPVVRHFVKYAIVGVWNTLLFLAIFNALLSAGFIPAIAFAPAFVVASLNSYLLNRHWTFRDRRRDPIVGQYLRFIFFTSIGLMINEVILHVLLQFLRPYGRIGENLAALGSLPVSVLWNFLAYRRWTFKAPTPSAGP